MSRPVRFAIAALVAVLLVGCKTSEIKNEVPVGLADDVPAGSVQSGYGDGKGDSVGGGGAGSAYDASKGSSSSAASSETSK